MNSESQDIKYTETWRGNTLQVMTLFEKKFISELIDIVETARNISFRVANLMQVASNWLLGWRIVEQEQHGEKRAAYGKHIIEIASKAMTEKFGQGFSETTLRAYRKFYQEFPFLQIQRALPAEFNSKIEEIQRPLLAEFKLSSNELAANGQPMLTWHSTHHLPQTSRCMRRNISLICQRKKFFVEKLSDRKKSFVCKITKMMKIEKRYS